MRGYLLPGAAEQDSLFRLEILRLGHLGLWLIGGTEIAVAIFMLVAQVLTETSDPALLAGRAGEAALIIAVGVVTLAVARIRASYSRARFLTCLSGWLASAMLIGSSLWLTPQVSAGDNYIPLLITTVMLVTVTVTPVRPLDTFLLGISIGIFFLAASLAALSWGLLDTASWDPAHLWLTLMLTLLSTGLTVVLYAQRSSHHRAYQEALRMAQELAAAQGRALLSENAISVGRLAAALTHELNTPLGALKSSIDTMLVVAGRQATAPPEAQARLVAMQAELRRSVSNSHERLQKTIARLQRFIDLDHTERQPIDLNELLGDVAILFAPQLKDNVKLEFQLQPLPRLTCRPQQLSTVFSSLLSNAINAINGDGRIVISTQQVGSVAEVRIQDNGRGMEPAELETIFDPGFKVTAGRVGTGNWSLFSSRQIVFEHGGEIQIASQPGQGTTVSVLLPL